MKQIRWSHYVVGVLFLCAIGLARYYNLTNMLSLHWLHAHITELQTYVDKHYVFSAALYLATYIGASLCALPGSTVFIMAGGLLFGNMLGALFALIGATVGSLLLFLSSRYVIGAFVQTKYKERFVRFNNAITRYGFHYLLIVRFVAVIPFFLVNVLSGITVISTRSFVGATVVGMLPLIFVYAFIGQQLTLLDSIDDFFNPHILAAFAMFFLFRVIVVPFVAKRAQIF